MSNQALQVLDALRNRILAVEKTGGSWSASERIRTDVGTAEGNLSSPPAFLIKNGEWEVTLKIKTGTVVEELR